jgi:LysM repeat protein/ABC-type branched-subunit amino acid transport system substrate-binding protein
LIWQGALVFYFGARDIFFKKHIFGTSFDNIFSNFADSWKKTDFEYYIMQKDFFQKTGLLLLLVFSFVMGMPLVAQNDSVGQRIVIDGEEYFLHVVQPGEGLYSIARRYNVTQQEILEVNPEMGEGLKKGQVIRIPVIKGRNTSHDEIESTGDFILHTVEKGQTVWYISRRYNVDVEDIYRYNPDADQKLIVGSIIKVPEKKQKDVVGDGGHFLHHKVKPGDTLYSLSRRYNIAIEDIIEQNPALRNGILTIGSDVRIPCKEEADSSVQTVEQRTAPKFIEGEKYVYYEIQPGQTLYSISKRYQVALELIQKANPDINTNDLKPGYMLRIPKVRQEPNLVEQKREEQDLFEKHKVRRKETLFSISRRYNVDMETIRKVNPAIDFTNLRRGTELKIPKDQWFIQNYPAFPKEEKQIVSEDSDSSGIGLFLPEEGLCVNDKGIGHSRPVKVALLMPFALDETETVNILQKVKDGDTIPTIRKDRIISRRSRIFAEFYEGVLLALDKLKKENVNVDLLVYDIAPDTEKVKFVLDSNPELKNVDMIIGPARSDDLSVVSEFAMKHEIKLIYPLSNVNPELNSNPYIFQINTPDTLVFDCMTNEIVRQAGDYNILAIVPEPDDEYADEFLERLRKKVFLKEFSQNKSINYKEYKMIGNEDRTNLGALLDPQKKNYVVVPTNNEATISKIVPTLAGIAEQQKINISLFGMTEWLRSQSIDPEDMFTLNAQIFTFFAFDYDSNETRNFIQKYREWYHTEPHAVSSYFQNSSSSSGYSRYGAWGYDVAYYFISAMARRGENFEYCTDPLDVHPVQFNFSFKRISNWGGFYNQGIFLLKFMPEFKVERVPVLSMQPVSRVEDRNEFFENF